MKLTVTEKAAQLKEKLAAYRKLEDDSAAIELKDLPVETKNQLDGLTKEINELSAAIESEKGYEAQRAQNEILNAALNKPSGRPDFANTDRNQPQSAKSVGGQFVDSPEFKSFCEELGIKGVGYQIAQGVKVDMRTPVEVKGLVYSGTPGSSANTTGGAGIRRDYDTTVDLPLRPLTIRSVISNGRTSSNLVEYVRITTKTRAADVVPEATATTSTGYSNAAKPEAALAWVIVQEPVKTIAVWMPITRQALSDAPQLQGDIDSFLQMDLDLALEDQIISGTGGTDFTGLENTVGLTPHAAVAGDDMLATSRKARTTAMVVAHAPSTAYLLNPYDWETIDLLRNATAGNFYMGGPTVMGIQQLWGIPVVESEVIPRGTGYTGNLREAKVYDREATTIRITDSHSDFFTHNMLAVLAEFRAAFTVRRPAAIVKIDWLVGANS